MSNIEVGKQIPEFTALATSGINFKLNDYQGKNLLLYFYPRDNTSGCTQEGKDFRDNIDIFKNKNVDVIGISRDGIKAHENFKAKHEFPFELISDKDESVCHIFDVIKEKKMYGKTHMGIERSTFLIDKKGVLIKAWRKVKLKVHLQEVLDEIAAL